MGSQRRQHTIIRVASHSQLIQLGHLYQGKQSFLLKEQQQQCIGIEPETSGEELSFATTCEFMECTQLGQINFSESSSIFYLTAGVLPTLSPQPLQEIMK